MKITGLRFIVPSCLFLLGGAFGFSYSFSANAGMNGAGVFSVGPTLTFSASPDVIFNGEVVAQYGFLPNFDVVAGLVNADLYPQAAYLGSWIMPRYEIFQNHILALGMSASYDRSLGSVSFALSPQYHFIYEGDRFAFEVNVIASIPLSDPAGITFSAVIAPVWKAIPDILAFYLEIDPEYAPNAADPFTLMLVPGVDFLIPDSPHEFNLGVILGDLFSGSPTFGIGFSYTLTIPLFAEKEEATTDS
jgi:hypothetical protein